MAPFWSILLSHLPCPIILRDLALVVSNRRFAFSIQLDWWTKMKEPELILSLALVLVFRTYSMVTKLADGFLMTFSCSALVVILTAFVFFVPEIGTSRGQPFGIGSFGFWTFIHVPTYYLSFSESIFLLLRLKHMSIKKKLTGWQITHLAPFFLSFFCPFFSDLKIVYTLTRRREISNELRSDQISCKLQPLDID